MIKSMTGFGSREAQIAPLGKICVELRSSNHKFLETVFHLPDGFLALEGNMKKEIEARIKRGRVTCALNFTARRACAASVNRPLLKEYVSILKDISKQYGLKDEIDANALIHLPGVLAVEECDIPKAGIWVRLKALVDLAVEDLDKTRQKEGRALYHLLKNRAEALRIVSEPRRRLANEQKLAFDRDNRLRIFPKCLQVHATDELDDHVYAVEDISQGKCRLPKRQGRPRGKL